MGVDQLNIYFLGEYVKHTTTFIISPRETTVLVMFSKTCLSQLKSIVERKNKTTPYFNNLGLHDKNILFYPICCMEITDGKLN